jgi:hypothetical protein
MILRAAVRNYATEAAAARWAPCQIPVDQCCLSAGPRGAPICCTLDMPVQADLAYAFFLRGRVVAGRLGGVAAIWASRASRRDCNRFMVAARWSVSPEIISLAASFVRSHGVCDSVTLNRASAFFDAIVSLLDELPGPAGAEPWEPRIRPV